MRSKIASSSRKCLIGSSALYCVTLHSQEVSFFWIFFYFKQKLIQNILHTFLGFGKSSTALFYFIYLTFTVPVVIPS